MKVGDRVRQIGEPESIPCYVMEVKDLGYGEGNERVGIQLPILGLTRYYTTKELVVIEGE